MSSFPRRSARLAPHGMQGQHATRSLTPNSVPTLSQYSQTSSTSTSSHPSPSNNSLNPPPPPPTPQQAGLTVQSHNLMPRETHNLNAPLPSPSASDINPFFGRPHSQPNPYQSQQVGSVAGQPNQAAFPQQGQEQPPQLHPHTNSMSHPNPQSVGGMNPGQMPPDFLAEAAKRAQIACLMRDMGDVSL